MATQSWLLTVSVLIEQDTEVLDGRRTDDEFQEAVTAAIAALSAGRTDTVVEWQSSSSTPLDGVPAVGRCAVCQQWVFDLDNFTRDTPTGISRGAVLDGRYRCDVHLPTGHPHCFCDRGYDGPVPDAIV